MAKIPTGDAHVKVTKTLTEGVLQAWLVASEKEQGNEIVPGSFKWLHGTRQVGAWMSERSESYFDGVSYEVAPIVNPEKRCPIARHHHDCDCNGAGGDR